MRRWTFLLLSGWFISCAGWYQLPPKACLSNQQCREGYICQQERCQPLSEQNKEQRPREGEPGLDMPLREKAATEDGGPREKREYHPEKGEKTESPGDGPLPCGDGLCDIGAGESCANCPADCRCPDGQECHKGSCRLRCGNRRCDTGWGENCSTCRQDCKCPKGEYCQKGVCKPLCGNGACDSSEGEDCSACPQDCKCPAGQECRQGACGLLCGNGSCDSSKGEDCSTCTKDCKCQAKEYCQQGSCKPLCGNGQCNNKKGENCTTCLQDCPCHSTHYCQQGVCKPYCGNGSCESNRKENCASCPKDCACQVGQQCIKGVCQKNCSCTPGKQKCASSDYRYLYTCDSDCRTWKKTRCPGTTPYCAVSLNKCAVCNPYHRYCAGSNLMICKSDGSGYKATTCSAGYGCDGNSCKPCNCKAGDPPKCSGLGIQYCNGCMWSYKSCQGIVTPPCVNGKCCICNVGRSTCVSGTRKTCRADCRSYSLYQCPSGKCCGADCCT